jgi:hypothetical protein
MIPGSNEHITYPGDYYYLAGALRESARTGISLLSDIPGLPIPGLEVNSPAEDAKALSAILAMGCVKIALPAFPQLSPRNLMEFRAENKETLRAFRRSMLRYAADLKEKIRDATWEELEAATKFFVATEIVPVLDELKATMDGPARPWFKRAIDLIRVVPSFTVAFMSMDTRAAIAKVLVTYAAQFFVEATAKGEQRETLKRSGLYYLLRLQGYKSDE